MLFDGAPVQKRFVMSMPLIFKPVAVKMITAGVGVGVEVAVAVGVAVALAVAVGVAVAVAVGVGVGPPVGDTRTK